jgi:hypothetical protein
MLGSFPVDPQLLERLANGLGTDQLRGPASLDTLFGEQGEGPQTRLEPKIAGRTVQQGFEGIGIDAFEGSA